MAFYECKGIISVTIPNSVISIENQAFYFCTSLTSVRVEATTPPKLDSNAFNRCPDLTKILVPSASVNAYKTASGWSNYASKIRGF